MRWAVVKKVDPLEGLDSEAPNFPPVDPAKYGEWFIEQVELGLRESDDPNTVFYTNDEVFAAIDARIAAWQQRTEKQKDAA